MRQKDDLTFAQCLTRLAVGALTTDDKKLLVSRRYDSENDVPSTAKGAIRIIWRNKDVDAYNVKKIQEIENAFPDNMKITYEAIDSIARGEHTQAQVNNALKRAKELPYQKTHCLPVSLKLIQGVRYMVTNNIDVSDGLFNGATGILKFIEIRSNKPYAVYLKFDDSSVGRKARTGNVNSNCNIEEDWIPILRRKEQFTTTAKSSINVIREQYPLVPAEAITIHKSQGQSLEQVVVHLDKGMNRQLLYVACSRATSLAGLFLVGEKFIPPNPPTEQDSVTNEMNRLRREAQLLPTFVFLRIVPDNVIQIVSHNVQSLNAHKSTINADAVYKSSTMLAFQETWLKSNDIVHLENFEETVRNTSNNTGTARGRGTIIFSRNTLEPTNKQSYENHNNSSHFEATTCTFNNIVLVNVYVSPSASTTFFKGNFLK